MKKPRRSTLLSAPLAALCLAGLAAPPLAAQEAAVNAAVPGHAPPAPVRLTLEEAKQRALENNKLLNLAALNAEGKAYAIKAARADYFPKVTGTALYMHFNDDLGTVLATQGRHVTGPRGTPLLTFPATVINVAVFNQDTSYAVVNVLQPITDLLKVRQGVRIAVADQHIAQAEWEKGVRTLVSGVEQLYWGILAARRLRAGAVEGVRGAELLAKTKTLEARTALVEAKQGLEQVDKQLADLQEQLNGLLGLPLCTPLDLVEPPLPVLPYHCADEVIGLALQASPEVREAAEDIHKAQAALTAGKLDYVPSIAAVGGYMNQTAQSYVQQDIGYIGVVASYTFVDWGKRRNTICERKNLVAMATLKLQQTEDEVRQKAQKAFREVAEAEEAFKTAGQMVELRKEAEKKARTPEALRDPTPLMLATKARMLAEVDFVKAELACRQAYVQLMSLVGGH
jgi:outer membrane protein TolC